MPKFMYAATYSTEGLQGLISEGGSTRRQAAQAVVEALGGTLDGFWFAYGDDDVYVVLDMPDGTAAAAGSMLTSAAGGVSIRTIPLITPEEMDEMAAKAREVGSSYRPPGA